jgi:hypothetical protein
MAAAWGWTARHGVHPVLVVAANDKAALGALLRPLPHYGCKGYLIFDGGKAARQRVMVGRAGPASDAVGLKAGFIP